MYNKGGKGEVPLKHRWLRAWLVQVALMLAACLLQAATYPVSPALYGALLWGAVPLAGLATACLAVRRGLNNYLAWLAPAPCLYAAHYALWRFAPSPGAALLTAFASLVGAAAGEVLNRRGRRR